MDVLQTIGKAVSKLRPEVRKGLICELAERPTRAGSIMVCYGLAASLWLPQLDKALQAALTLCEIGERVAVFCVHVSVSSSDECMNRA